MTRPIPDTYSILNLMNPFFVPPRNDRHPRAEPEDWRPGRRVFHPAPRDRPSTG